MEFTGKSAIVTGAASGIGFAVAALLVERGAKVLAVDVNEAAVQEAASSVGEGFVPWAADVAQADQVKAYVEQAVELFGSIDYFFNNAGVEGPFKSSSDITLDEWHRATGINLNGAFYGFKYVTEQMRKTGGGSIVATGSNVSLTGAPNRIDYVTSKHAILGMTRAVASEYGEGAVRANCICPGPVETPLMERAESLASADDPSIAHKAYAAISPMNRYARPQEVAETVLFLLSDRAEFINGSAVSIDGGFCAN